MTAPRRSHVSVPTHRLIASRYPTVGVFDDLSADVDDLRAAFLLEAITNDRLSRRLAHLPDDEIVHGPGGTLVVAAFLHADEAGGRFTDGRLGAWYAAFDVATAIAETVYHHTRRLKLSADAFPSAIQMRQLVASVDCELIDIRGMKDTRPDLYDPDSYAASQPFGVALRWPETGPGENGIVYDAVRHAPGTNVCIYRPSQVRLPVVQADHYEYRWDRTGSVTMLRLTDVGPAPLPT